MSNGNTVASFDADFGVVYPTQGGGDNIFKVRINTEYDGVTTTYNCDKTTAEILDAFDSGKLIVGYLIDSGTTYQSTHIMVTDADENNKGVGFEFSHTMTIDEISMYLIDTISFFIHAESGEEVIEYREMPIQIPMLK